MRAAAALIALVTLSIAVPAGAQIAAPGLALDRTDLPLVAFTGRAAIKGAKPAPPAVPIGYITGGIGYAGGFSVCIAGCFYTGPSTLSNTLLPPFVSGGVYVALAPGSAGMMVSMFEPDLINRKATAKETRAKFKQKNWVGVRFKTGIIGTTAYTIAVVDGCKAQADLRSSLTEPTRIAKFKASCKKGALDDLLDGVGFMGPDQSDLENFFKSVGLKKKAGFDLVGEQGP